MLDLSSPVWQQLHSPFGSSEAVPGLLQQLQNEYTTEVKDELYWEHLFHQDTIYSSTYAALPYLSELARLSDDPEVKLDIYVTCGMFVANQMTVQSGKQPLNSPIRTRRLLKSLFKTYIQPISLLLSIWATSLRRSSAMRNRHKKTTLRSVTSSPQMPLTGAIGRLRVYC